MRTTALWSLALLAGSAIAAPPAYYGSNRTDTTCTEEKLKSSPTAPVYPISYGSKASSSSKSATWSYSFSGNSSSYGPTATGGYGGKPSTVTVITTTYTTVCPGTATHVTSGTTSLSTYTTTSTITETLTLTVPAGSKESPSWSEASPNGPGAYPSLSEVYTPSQPTTVTKHTTVYTTVCPVTTTGVWGDKTITRAYETTSTVTSVWSETITLGAVPSPTGYGSGYAPVESESGHKGTSEVGATKSQYNPEESKSVEHAATPSVTTVTKTQTIIVQKTTTAVQEGTTVTKAYNATSLHTSVYTSTCTEGAYTHWTTVQYGTTWFSYTVPQTTPTSSAESSSTKKHETTGPEAPWYPIPSKSSKYPGGYGSGVVPSGSKFSSKPYASGTGSSKSSTKLSPTGSIPVSSKSSTKSASTVSGSKVSSKPSASGSVSSKPSSIASFTKTTSTSTSTSSSCSKPTPTLAKDCVPCEGQPGSDPEKFCGYTIEDNWYEVTPKTCRTVEYNFEITNGTISPDGVPRIGFMINGQMPGPKIEANWGDTVVVHVTNSLANNGSSIHFHGIRQLNTNEMDGVPSITQCALAPGDSMTYTWVATNYGSSWYHSHFAIQTYEGVFGPMTIHGPATAEYDFEQSIIVQDWSHATVDSMYDESQTVGPKGGPRTLDTGLINGLNVWGGADGAAGTVGERFSMTVVSGKRYRLRLVNTAIQSTFKFYIDGHKFKVIAMDFVPIVPYETQIVNINIGQRYDLIFTADQKPGNYWMRSDNQQVCAKLAQPNNIKGIVTYEGVTPGTPTSTAYTYTAECVDEPLASLIPYVPLNAGASADQSISETVVIGPNGGQPNLFKWTLSGTTFQSQWGDPTLNHIVNNGTIPTYSGRLAIEVPKLQEWVYIIIDSPIPLPHPIHLHGHDFFILAQGKGLYSSSVVLNTVNPPRRDVALMPYDAPLVGAPSGGHLVLAFQTDNPGAWLMHCHIGWHVSMGFALQIIEGQDYIKDTVTDTCQMQDTCSAWNSYATANEIVTNDSGV